MPAKRAIILPKYQPVAVSHDEQVTRLARASALLAKGCMRRLEAVPLVAGEPPKQLEVAIHRSLAHKH